MSERLRQDLAKAERFQALHIQLQSDYETYCREMLQEWKKDADTSHSAGESIKPLWLRRTDDTGAEFGAVIDYIIPMRDKVGYLAAIDIDGTGGQTDISVLMPSEDGSGEPVRVTQEAYTLPALQRAIEYVESHVSPAVE